VNLLSQAMVQKYLFLHPVARQGVCRARPRSSVAVAFKVRLTVEHFIPKANNEENLRSAIFWMYETQISRQVSTVILKFSLAEPCVALATPRLISVQEN
jgi:hypothetical protein